MSYREEERSKIVNNFLGWCEKIGYSGKDGVKVIIVEGLPLAVERPCQSLRFDQTLTKSKQNTTMD